MNEVTVESLQKDLRNKHGVNLDISKYSKAQLEGYSAKIEGKLKEFKSKNKFDESLSNDTYQKTLLIGKIVEAAINQYLDNPLEDEDVSEADMITVDESDEDVARDFNVTETGAILDIDDTADVVKKGLKAVKKGVKKALKASPGANTNDDDGEKYADESVKEGVKPDYLDMDKDGDKKEPMKKALKDKKKNPFAKKEESVKEGDNIYHDCVKSFKHQKFGEGTVLHGEHTLAEDGTVTHYDATFVNENGQEYIVRNIPVANMYETVVEGHGHPAKKKKMKKEEIEQVEKPLKEGAEEKAELTMAAKDMVDRFTAFLEDVAEMGAEGMLELADSIRDELGQEQADQFVNTVKPALERTQEVLTTAREALTSGVGIITGEGGPVDTIGDEPADLDTGADDLGDISEPIEPEADEFGASEPATGGEEPEGREKRESYTPKKSSVTESTRVLNKLAK